MGKGNHTKKGKKEKPLQGATEQTAPDGTAGGGGAPRKRYKMHPKNFVMPSGGGAGRKLTMAAKSLIALGVHVAVFIALLAPCLVYGTPPVPSLFISLSVVCMTGGWTAALMTRRYRILRFAGAMLASVLCLRIAYTLSVEVYMDGWARAVSIISGTFQTFTLDADYVDTVGNAASAFGSVGYIIFALTYALMSVVAPATGGFAVFTVLSQIFPRLKLWARNFYATKYVFSELNEYSIATAESIHALRSGGRPANMGRAEWRRIRSSVIIFTDAYTDREQESSSELLGRANRIGAVCLKDDITELNLRWWFRLARKKRAVYFLMDMKEENNLKGAVSVLSSSPEVNRWAKLHRGAFSHFANAQRAAKMEMYVFSGNPDACRTVSDELKNFNDTHIPNYLEGEVNAVRSAISTGVFNKISEKAEKTAKELKGRGADLQFWYIKAVEKVAQAADGERASVCEAIANACGGIDLSGTAYTSEDIKIILSENTSGISFGQCIKVFDMLRKAAEGNDPGEGGLEEKIQKQFKALARDLNMAEEGKFYKLMDAILKKLVNSHTNKPAKPAKPAKSDDGQLCSTVAARTKGYLDFIEGLGTEKDAAAVEGLGTEKDAAAVEGLGTKKIAAAVEGLGTKKIAAAVNGVADELIKSAGKEYEVLTRGCRRALAKVTRVLRKTVKIADEKKVLPAWLSRRYSEYVDRSCKGRGAGTVSVTPEAVCRQLCAFAAAGCARRTADISFRVINEYRNLVYQLISGYDFDDARAAAHYPLYWALDSKNCNPPAHMPKQTSTQGEESASATNCPAHMPQSSQTAAGGDGDAAAENSAAYMPQSTQKAGCGTEGEGRLSSLNIAVIGSGKISKEFIKAAYWCGQMMYRVRKSPAAGDKGGQGAVTDGKEGHGAAQYEYRPTSLSITVLGKEAYSLTRRQLAFEMPEAFNGEHDDYCKFKFFDTVFGTADGGQGAGGNGFEEVFKANCLEADYVLVALGDDDLNMRAASWVKHTLDRKNLASPRCIPVNFAIENSDLCAAIQRDARGKGGGCILNAFGSVASRYDIGNIISTRLDDFAYSVNCAHDEGVEKRAFLMDEYKRNSSVASALHLPYKLVTFGKMECNSLFNVKKVNVQASAGDESDELVPRYLLEHRRWNAYMRSEGYRCPDTAEFFRMAFDEKGKYDGGKHKDAELRLHACLLESDNHIQDPRPASPKALEDILKMGKNVSVGVPLGKWLDENVIVPQKSTFKWDRLDKVSYLTGTGFKKYDVDVVVALMHDIERASCCYNMNDEFYSQKDLGFFVRLASALSRFGGDSQFVLHGDHDITFMRACAWENFELMLATTGGADADELITALAKGFSDKFLDDRQNPAEDAESEKGEKQKFKLNKLERFISDNDSSVSGNFAKIKRCGRRLLQLWGTFKGDCQKIRRGCDIDPKKPFVAVKGGMALIGLPKGGYAKGVEFGFVRAMFTASNSAEGGKKEGAEKQPEE